MAKHAYAPGSPQAIRRGCVCPRELNHYGIYPPVAGGKWWLDLQCGMHASWLTKPARVPRQRSRRSL